MKQVKAFLEAQEELEDMILAKDSFWCSNPCVHMDSNEIRKKLIEVQKMRNELKSELGDNAKKLLSELTEEDAIKIAVAATGGELKAENCFIDKENEVEVTFEDDRLFTISIIPNMDYLKLEFYYCDHFHAISINASAATDKARELGYNV